MAGRATSRTVRERDGGDTRLLRVIVQPDPDRGVTRVRVTYMGEEGARTPIAELGLTHRADVMYGVDQRLTREEAAAEGLARWRADTV